MITLRIDSNTRDLTLDASGAIATIDNYADHARQALELTLRAWLGDWMLDLAHGTDYKSILGTAASKRQVERVLRDAIAQVDEVYCVDDLQVSCNGRTVVAAVACTAKDGSRIKTEVTTG